MGMFELEKSEIEIPESREILEVAVKRYSTRKLLRDWIQRFKNKKFPLFLVHSSIKNYSIGFQNG